MRIDSDKLAAYFTSNAVGCMMMLQRQVVPPWVVEHPEVFDPEFSLTADVQGLPVTDYSVSKMQGNSNTLKFVLSVSTYYSLEYACCNICV